MGIGHQIGKLFGLSRDLTKKEIRDQLLKIKEILNSPILNEIVQGVSWEKNLTLGAAWLAEP